MINYIQLYICIYICIFENSSQLEKPQLFSLDVTRCDVAGADERRCQRDQGRLWSTARKIKGSTWHIHGLHGPFTRVEALIGEPLIH